MSQRRYHISGHIYHVTTNIYNRLNLFTNSAYILPLLGSLNFYRHKHQFKLLGYVIMLDHLHLLLWPRGEAMLDIIMRDFKKFTAVRLIRQAEVEGRADLLEQFAAAGKETGRGKNKVWQDSYWDKNIFSERFLRQRLNYIHRNPMRASLVKNAEDYPYSSYRNYALDDHSLIKIDQGWTS